MSLEAFDTIADVVTYLGANAPAGLGGSGSGDDASALDEQVDQLLELASATIRDETGQDITLVEDDEIELRGNWGPELWLPQRPVLEVSAITIDGLALLPGSWRASRDGKVTFYAGTAAIGNLGDTGCGYWGGTNVFVNFTYTHGLDPIPDTIKGLTLELVKRAMTAAPTAGSVDSETIGSYSVRYSRDAAQTLTRDEKRKLRRWIRSNHTITVGQ